MDVSDLNSFKDKLVISDYGASLFSCAINNDGDLGCISGSGRGGIYFFSGELRHKHYVILRHMTKNLNISRTECENLAKR